MADKWLAGRPIKIGSTTYQRGDDVTAQIALLTKHGLHSLLANGRVVKVQTTTTQANKAKQKIPIATERPLRRQTGPRVPKLDH